MMMSIVFLLISLFGQVGDARPPNFFVFPVRTDLERTLLGLDHAGNHAAVFVHARALIQESSLDWDALDADVLEDELAEYAGSQGDTVYFNLRLPFTVDREVVKLLVAKLKQLRERAGFEREIAAQAFSSGQDSWQWDVKLLRSVPYEGAAEVDETASGNGEFAVYPVRTRLSRLLTDKADCVIDVLQPVEEHSGVFLTSEMQDAIGIQMAALNFKSNSLVHFRIHRLICREKGLLRLGPHLNRVATDLGFGSAVFMVMSQEDIRFKDLLGKPAPDFRLQSLTTLDEQSLRELIHGKVAVLAFWGHGCGPCRAEAPYLKAWYERYRDRGFVVVAVNTYDESPELIRKFVEEQNLTYPILLHGSAVGRDLYHCPAYPVTYYIDHEGRCVDRDMGFDPSDVTRIEATIERLMAAKAEHAGQ